MLALRKGQLFEHHAAPATQYQYYASAAAATVCIATAHTGTEARGVQCKQLVSQADFAAAYKWWPTGCKQQRHPVYACTIGGVHVKTLHGRWRLYM